MLYRLSYFRNFSGQRWIRTTEGVSQQIYSLPHLATLVFAPTLQKELFSLLNHRRVNFTRTISVLISSPPREERLIPLILERASCRIRTNDPEITNHVLWPTELKRQVGKLTISRRYNQLPLLRSSPGGFEGSWPYRTYPAAKVQTFSEPPTILENIFSPFNGTP